MSSHTSAGAPASCTAQAGMLPFSSALNPLPSCKQKANAGLLFGMFSLMGYWPGGHAALQQYVETIPILQTKGK